MSTGVAFIIWGALFLAPSLLSWRIYDFLISRELPLDSTYRRFMAAGLSERGVRLRLAASTAGGLSMGLVMAGIGVMIIAREAMR